MTEDARSAVRARELAQHWVGMHRFDRALEVLGGAGVDHDDVHVWYLRAFSLDKLEQSVACDRAIAEGLARDPEYVPLLELASRVHGERGELAQAESMALAALRLAPQNAGLLAGYARLCAKAGQLDKARALVDRALQFDPDHADVRAMHGLLAFAGGDDRALAREGQALLQRNPSDQLGHRLMAAQHLDAGRIGSAADHLREIVKHDLKDTEAVEAARQTRLWAHPLMYPLRPFAGVSMGKTWIIAVVGIAILRLFDSTVAAFGALLWILLCLYSWTVPFLLRKWLDWRAR